MAPPQPTVFPKYLMVRIPGSGWDISAGATCCDFSKVSAVAASYAIPRFPSHPRFTSQQSTSPTPVVTKLVPEESQQQVCNEVMRRGLKRTFTQAHATSQSSSSLTRLAKVARVEKTTLTTQAAVELPQTTVEVEGVTTQPPRGVSLFQPRQQIPPNARVILKPISRIPRNNISPQLPSQMPAAQSNLSTVSSAKILVSSQHSTAASSSGHVQSEEQLQTAQIKTKIPVEVYLKALKEESKQLKQQNQMLTQRLLSIQRIFTDKRKLQRVMSRFGIEVY